MPAELPSQPALPQPALSQAALSQPAPANRAERRGTKKPDPATAGYRGSDGPAGPARSSARGRRVNPVRRTG